MFSEEFHKCNYKATLFGKHQGVSNNVKYFEDCKSIFKCEK